MNKFLIAVIVFSFLPGNLLAQENIRKNLKGKVTADATNIKGIYIINMKTEKTVLSEEGGYFSIPAMEGDTLVFSSIHFKGRKIAVKSEDFSSNLFFVKLDPLMIQLDEVQVYNYKNINAVALGIIPKGQKSYTPAERRLKSATGLDAQIGLNTSLTIDPLFNLLSGRTASLLKQVEVERKELMIEKIENMYQHEYFVDRLKIPEDHVKGFLFYLVENKKFTDSANTKNKTMTTFIMNELAVQYLETISETKK